MEDHNPLAKRQSSFDEAQRVDIEQNLSLWGISYQTGWDRSNNQSKDINISLVFFFFKKRFFKIKNITNIQRYLIVVHLLYA